MNKVLALTILAFFLASCSSGSSEIAPTIDVAALETMAVKTIMAEVDLTATANAPTATPMPTSTPIPTSTPTPLPEPLVFSGNGDMVVDVNKWYGPSLLHIKYFGDSNFVVWNYNANGEEIDLLVNTIGNYEGTRPLDFLDGEETARLQIESSGNWEVTVMPFEHMRQVSIPGAFEGLGDDVVYMKGTGTPDLLNINADQAQSNFVIWGYGKDVDLLVNDIAPYSGVVIVPASLPVDSALVLIVEAEGNWSIEVTTK